MPHQFDEASLPLEGFHEAQVREQFQYVHWDTARQIDATCRKYFQCEIACLTRKDRNKHVDGGPAQLAWSVWLNSGLDNYYRGVFCGSNRLRDFGLLRYMLNVT
jgi:hypothetical protein